MQGCGIPNPLRQAQEGQDWANTFLLVVTILWNLRLRHQFCISSSIQTPHCSSSRRRKFQPSPLEDSGSSMGMENTPHFPHTQWSAHHLNLHIFICFVGLGCGCSWKCLVCVKIQWVPTVKISCKSQVPSMFEQLQKNPPFLLEEEHKGWRGNSQGNGIMDNRSDGSVLGDSLEWNEACGT